LAAQLSDNMHSSASYAVFLENVNNKKIGQYAGVWKQVVKVAPIVELPYLLFLWHWLFV
jgi:hypothetical protein